MIVALRMLSQIAYCITFMQVFCVHVKVKVFFEVNDVITLHVSKTVV